MTIEIAVLISIVSVCFSVYFGLKNNKRSDTKEIESRVAENTRINIKLDGITQTTNDIKQEVSSMRNDIQAHNERIIKVEESLKSAHHRLNTLEERMNKEGDGQ